MGLLSYHGFAEFDVANQNAVVKLPSTLDNRPFPAEPLGCGINVFRRAGIKKGDTVAIVGVGFLGAIVIRLAALAGARVIAFTTTVEAVNLRQAGADWVLSSCADIRLLAQDKGLTLGFNAE